MAVDTSNPPSVPGPRTPYALYPELTQRACEHKGFLWRAGFKRSTDGRDRYTSEYQRQFQPIPEERQQELVISRAKERDRKRAVASVREVFREVEGEERPPVEQKESVLQQEDVNVVTQSLNKVKAIPDEVVKKRPAKKTSKRGAKRHKKDPLPPFPLSEYQAQFQAWDSLMKEKQLFPVTSAPPDTQKKQSAEIRPAPAAPVKDPLPSYSIQRSPRRWNSEYRSNYSLRSSHDVIEDRTSGSWYQMVVELRERARTYRDRGRSSALALLQLPLSQRRSEISDSSRPPSARPATPVPQASATNVPVQTSDSKSEPEPAVILRDRTLESEPAVMVRDRTLEREPAVMVRDSATQVTRRSQHPHTHKPIHPAVDTLESSFSKLNVTTPHATQLAELERPNSSQLHRAISNTLRASVENHKSPSATHEAVRARTAVPPIDINRIRYSPSPIPAHTLPIHSSPNYMPAPVPLSALSQADESLQTQLFRYKESAPPPGQDQGSVASTGSLASHTLERAKHRQEFWK